MTHATQSDEPTTAGHDAAPEPGAPVSSSRWSASPREPRMSSEAHDAEEATQIDPRIQAMLPADLIQPGEVILLLVKPSAWSIVLESLKTLAVVALIVAAALWADQYNRLPLHRNDVIVAALTLATLRLFWEFLDWMGRFYILTDRRVVRVHGVSRVQVVEAPLQKIDHTSLTFSNRERFVGLGTLVFTCFDHAVEEVHWRMISRPGEVSQVVTKLVERYR